MANDLLTNDDPAVFWAQCLTPSAAAVLNRAFEPGATFTADEVALVAPISNAVATIHPADEETIRKSIGSLSAVLPSKDNGEAGERLRLNVYMTMLAGCDERALAHACRRCCDELDWMPTIHQLKDRMRGWISPEAVAISKARAVMRARRAEAEGGDQPPPDAAEVERVNGFMRRAGLSTRFAADGSTYQVEDRADGANEPAAAGQGEGIAA